jgi:hypothetical protein
MPQRGEGCRVVAPLGEDGLHAAPFISPHICKLEKS